MHTHPREVSAILCTICFLTGISLRAAEPVEWSGRGAYRLLVEVPPSDFGKRSHDEMPAEIPIDFEAELKKLGVNALPDIASIQVIRYDAATGRPLSAAADHSAAVPSDGKSASEKSLFDRSFRWYDAAIPYEFPEVTVDVSRSKGRLIRKPVTRGGYFYNALGDWKQGRLAWTHTQDAGQPSSYAVYFDVLPAGESAAEIPPRGWLGDGLPRCEELGTSTMGADHCRIDLDDWNDDGLVDLIVGEAYGHVFWWPNRGTRDEPKFPYSKFAVDADGLPIDAGSAAAPKVVDWDGDGVKDLLIGAEWNRILLFLNEGTNRDRQLRYAGLLKADGEVIKLPIAPLERGNPGVFKRDYYPVLETVDWDADGDVDLLAGGYVTGRVFFYENTARGEDGLPMLSLRGPLHADGKPLNVGHWCAAPCVADFDGDGDLDLMSGNMPVGVSGGDAEGSGTFLQYYENTGTRIEPLLHKRPFPADGKFPSARLATPRAFDWDDDGDLDLVVSARENVYLYMNEGDATKPRFRVHRNPLPSRWSAARITANQFLDWNKDGLPDFFTRTHYAVYLNSGQGNPWSWNEAVRLLPKGERIAHPSGIGDDWFWPFLDDFDQDDRIDVLFGDWHGQIWFHRNQSAGEQPDFDLDGEMLKLASGKPIKVGPIGGDPKTNFNALQGARTVFTVADFDHDGLRDLVVGDTYGKVRFFRNAGTRNAPMFADPIEIGDLGIRLLVDSTDWNQDGWDDVVAGAANGRVRVFLNTGQGGDVRFAAGFDPGLPTIPQPRVLMADLNGDGDEDLFLPSTQGSCLVERSFLEHGYAQGRAIRMEQRNE